MTLRPLTEHHLEFLSLKEAAQACLSLFMSKCHIVGNHMSWLISKVQTRMNPEKPADLDSSCFQNNILVLYCKG